MKVVLDTNVFISGIFWKGESNKTLTLWKEGKFELVVSLEIISEIAKVLNDFKIALPKETIKEIIDLILRNSLIVLPQQKVDFVKDDPSDNIFIEAALAGNGDYIVSQDKHLLDLKELKGIKIILPVEFNNLFR